MKKAATTTYIQFIFMNHNKEYKKGSITQKVKPCSIEDIGQTIAFQRAKPESKKKKKITFTSRESIFAFFDKYYFIIPTR